eukprot:g74397.t1
MWVLQEEETEEELDVDPKVMGPICTVEQFLLYSQSTICDSFLKPCSTNCTASFRSGIYGRSTTQFLLHSFYSCTEQFLFLYCTVSTPVQFPLLDTGFYRDIKGALNCMAM